MRTGTHLVPAYLGPEKAAEDGSSFHAANALGRFLGPLLYQRGGLPASLIGWAVMLVTCWLMMLALHV